METMATDVYIQQQGEQTTRLRAIGNFQTKGQAYDRQTA
jgi:hypothetical protein